MSVNSTKVQDTTGKTQIKTVRRFRGANQTLQTKNSNVTLALARQSTVMRGFSIHLNITQRFVLG